MVAVNSDSIQLLQCLFGISNSVRLAINVERCEAGQRSFVDRVQGEQKPRLVAAAVVDNAMF